jgi:hypothetical protein
MAHVTGDAAASGAGGHVGGEDVVWVPVEVLAGPVIPHGGAGIGMPGGDLDIAQVNPSIQHGRHESMPEHMGMWPGDPHARVLGEVAQAAGGGVPVHPGAAAGPGRRTRPAVPDRLMAHRLRGKRGRSARGSASCPDNALGSEVHKVITPLAAFMSVAAAVQDGRQRQAARRAAHHGRFAARPIAPSPPAD